MDDTVAFNDVVFGIGVEQVLETLVLDESLVIERCSCGIVGSSPPYSVRFAHSVEEGASASQFR
ncbi:hypothetical protein HAPAU_29450 [Halalkalicoccus paucihalophilus]|uniref:Uncharacterized protein n=1 Tax=Halalkalicoccus paucihalophilus TaxID=1008153 RepID=A0A151ABK4_9EURY|nr:hypothetical protein HAPAU_29450 [Halalkalicoccus paucihalophilus]